MKLSRLDKAQMKRNLLIDKALLEQCLEAFETDEWMKKLMAAQSIRNALQTEVIDSESEVSPSKKHSDAPHGFDR